MCTDTVDKFLNPCKSLKGNVAGIWQPQRDAEDIKGSPDVSWTCKIHLVANALTQPLREGCPSCAGPEPYTRSHSKDSAGASVP